MVLTEVSGIADYIDVTGVFAGVDNLSGISVVAAMTVVIDDQITVLIPALARQNLTSENICFMLTFE
jgi:hypothetical protein